MNLAFSGVSTTKRLRSLPASGFSGVSGGLCGPTLLPASTVLMDAATSPLVTLLSSVRMFSAESRAAMTVVATFMNMADCSMALAVATAVSS